LLNGVQIGVNKSFSGSTSTTAQFAWADDLIALSGDWTGQLQARRTAGAANGYLSTPRELVIGTDFPSYPAGGWV
jgi:hypothetical protein